MKTDTVLEKVTIRGMAAEGKCIAKVNDQVIFVEGTQTAPQEIVDLKIVYKKKNYAEAIVTHIHQPSPQRVEPFCTHFGTCGGCKWQHIEYSEQLAYKQQQVVDNLTRIGKLDLPPILPIIPSANTQFYRNKLEFTFSNKRWLTIEDLQALDGQILETPLNALGFHVPKRFDKILDIDRCYLQADLSNQIRLAIKQYATEHQLTFFDIKNKQGFLRNLIIRNTPQNEWMVIVAFFEEDKQQQDKLLSFLHQQFPQITSLLYLINPKGNDTFHDLEVHTFAGKPYLTELMPSIYQEKPLQFRVGAKSFYQTNSLQAFQLYKVAAQMADLQGNEILYDLYTGTGTIANFVAQKAQKVIGLEYVPAAIEDAKVNSVINDIHNTLFFAGDIKDLLNEEFLVQYGKPDVIITDPPRAGMHENVIKMMLQTAPKKIVYVSCNPATQARDLALLALEYSIEAVQPVDMFPHTFHVENVVLLKRKN